MPRRPRDFYETPPHYVDALLRAFPELSYDHNVIFEPCVGEGAISGYFANTITNDADANRNADWHMDATCSRVWKHARMRASLQQLSLHVVTNPPFNQAADILRQALKECPGVMIAMLLRLSFLEPTKARRDLLERHPPSSIIVLPRYSFRLNDKGKRATDSVTCAWMVWNREAMPRIRVDGNKLA